MVDKIIFDSLETIMRGAFRDDKTITINSHIGIEILKMQKLTYELKS